jgi:glycine cleavage system aminomethyltransferase T
MRGFREWLRADSWESQFQLGGSFRSRNLEDYYVTPWDLGYDRILKFDHDFIGRDALERRQHLPHRSKVTLVWNREDVLKVFGSMLQPEAQYKYIDLPIADYGFPHLDEVKSENGKFIGLSALCGYSVNEAEMLSLAMVSSECAQPGTQVVLTWGEPDGGSRKPRVERHKQTQIRATVAPAPYANAVRTMKGGAVGSATHPTISSTFG